MSSPGHRQPWVDITGEKNIRPFIIVESFPEVIYFLFRLLQYIGRDGAPSPATGSKAAHKKELAAFLDKAMSL